MYSLHYQAMCMRQRPSPSPSPASVAVASLEPLPSASGYTLAIPGDDLGIVGFVGSLQSRPANPVPTVGDMHYAAVARQANVHPLPPGFHQAGHVIGLTHHHHTSSLQGQARKAQAPSKFYAIIHPTDSPQEFCQEIQPSAAAAAGTDDAAVTSGSSSPGASRRSTPAPPSRNIKYKSTMCRNLLTCKHHKNGGCIFAHSQGELRRFLLQVLRDNKGVDYLVLPCFDCVMCGDCAFGENCTYLHDPNVKSDYGSKSGKCLVRAREGVSLSLIDSLRNRILNSVTQENVLVPNALWILRDVFQDRFEETRNFIANTHEGMRDMFHLPFVIQNNGTEEKLSTVQKMSIALCMHQKSPFSEEGGKTHQAHLNFTFNNGDAYFVDGKGKRCNILQKRYFKVFSGSNNVVEEVLFPPQAASDDIVVASELVFDAKGSRNCLHSIWFDADFVKADPKEKEAANKLKAEAHVVHSKPFFFMEPIDDSQEGHELIHSIMREMIISSILGVDLSTDLRDKFIQLNNHYRTLAWPKTKSSSDESAAAQKTIEGHVCSAYTCEGSKVEGIWESFETNLACVSDNEAPEGDSRLPVYQAGRCSVSFASDLPELPTENMADYLAAYSQ